MSGSLPCFSHISASHNLGPLRITLLIFLCRSINTLMPSNLMTLSLDEGQAYILLKKAQILQSRANVINQIRIRLERVDEAREVAARIEALYGYRAESWQEANEGVFGVFRIQNAIMYSTVGAIMVVAAFGIYNIISTVVYEKSRDIAILKSIGLTESDIRRTFLMQGLMIGLIGAVLGWLIGFGLTSL